MPVLHDRADRLTRVRARSTGEERVWRGPISWYRQKTFTPHGRMACLTTGLSILVPSTDLTAQTKRLALAIQPSKTRPEDDLRTEEQKLERALRVAEPLPA